MSAANPFHPAVLDKPVYDVYQRPPGAKHAGRWTFRVDGEESELFCPDEHAARRIVKRLQRGSDPGPGVSVARPDGRGRQRSRIAPGTSAADMARVRERAALRLFFRRGKKLLPEAVDAFRRQFGVDARRAWADKGEVTLVHPDGSMYDARATPVGVAFTLLVSGE